MTNLPKIHELGEILQVLKLDRQAKSVERLVKKTQDGTLGKETEDTMEDTDRVHIGDSVVYQQPLQQTPNNLLKYLLPIALGLSTGVGGMIVGSLLSSTPTPVSSSLPDNSKPQVEFPKESPYYLRFKE